jgi:hypothetical protein
MFSRKTRLGFSPVEVITFCKSIPVEVLAGSAITAFFLGKLPAALAKSSGTFLITNDATIKRPSPRLMFLMNLILLLPSKSSPFVFYFYFFSTLFLDLEVSSEYFFGFLDL